MERNQEHSGSGWAVALIFCVALLQRAVATGCFLHRWGRMATSGPEFWFYFGIASGKIPPLSPLDPTEWLLWLLGLMFRGEALFYALCSLGALLMALAALALFYLVREIHGRSVALIAALLYSSMVQPMFDSSATFIHELVLYPLFPLSILFAIRAMKNRRNRLLWILLCATLLFFAFQVGPSTTFALLAILFSLFAYMALKYLMWAGWDESRISILLVVALGITCVLLYRFILPPSLNLLYRLAFELRGIDVLAQIRAGSGDLQPISLQSPWLRLNAFIFFLPFGAYVAYRRRDFLSLSLTAFPLVTALHVERATRPAAFGVAILTALAFSKWEKRWSITFWGIVPFLFLAFFSSFVPSYGFFFLGAAALFWIILNFLRRDGEPSPIALGIVLALVIVMGTALPILNMEGKTTRGEYLSYKKLSGEGIDGSIFVPWSHGYFARAVSGLPSVLTPQNIREDLGVIYWMPEAEAWEALRKEGVGVIVVSDRDFRVLSSDPETGSFSYILSHALHSSPEQFGVTRMPILRRTLIFKLLYTEEELAQFCLIGETVDRATGFTYRTYILLN